MSTRGRFTQGPPETLLLRSIVGDFITTTTTNIIFIYYIISCPPIIIFFIMYRIQQHNIKKFKIFVVVVE